MNDSPDGLAVAQRSNLFENRTATPAGRKDLFLFHTAQTALEESRFRSTRLNAAHPLAPLHGFGS